MPGFANIVLLLCAIATCLALGVVFAYAACSALFAAMRPASLGVAQTVRVIES